MPIVAGDRGRVRPGSGVEDDRDEAARRPGPRSRRSGRERRRRRSAAAASAAASARRGRGRRSLGGVAPRGRRRGRARHRARRLCPPGRARAATGTGAEGLLRPHRGGLRDRPEASDRARRSAPTGCSTRRRRPAKSSPSAGAPRSPASSPAASRRRSASPGSARRSSSPHRATCSRLAVRGRQVVSRRKIVTRLPFERHQQDTIALGPDGRLYLGSGSTCDVCTEKDRRSGAILSFRQDGSDLRVVARGLRNPFGLVFDGPDALRLGQRPRRPRRERAGGDGRAVQTRSRLRLAPLLGELAAAEAAGLVPTASPRRSPTSSRTRRRTRSRSGRGR